MPYLLLRKLGLALVVCAAVIEVARVHGCRVVNKPSEVKTVSAKSRVCFERVRVQQPAVETATGNWSVGNTPWESWRAL